MASADKPESHLLQVGSLDIGQVIKANALPVVVDVWAPWCGPCRAMAPILEQSARQFASQARFVKLNGDDHPELVR